MRRLDVRRSDTGQYIVRWLRDDEIERQLDLNYDEFKTLVEGMHEYGNPGR